MIGALLAANAVRYPTSTAIVFGARQFTYAMLGRSDAGQARQEWDLLPKPDPTRIL